MKVDSNFDDGNSSDEEVKLKKQPTVKKEEPKPTIYSCAICTYENPLGAPTCEICATPRPPMEQML